MYGHIWILYLITFWLIIYYIYKIAGLERFSKKITIGVGYLIIRSERLNKLLIGFTRHKRNILNKIYTLGIYVGITLLFGAIIILLYNLYIYFTVAPGASAPAQLIIPGVTIGVETFLKMLPGLIIVIISHELSHKITLHLEGIKVKSVGFLLAFIIPAAFVEPDEDTFKKSKPKARMKVLSAGSFANITIALLFLPVIINPSIYYAFISPLYAPPSGVIISEIIPNTPLANYTEIEAGDVIIEINGIPIYDISDAISIQLSPGSNVEIRVFKRETGKIIKATLRTMPDPDDPSRGILGYYPQTYFPPKHSYLPYNLPNILYEIIFWIFFLSLNIGLFNMLPIYPLDGYSFLDSLFMSFGIREKLRKTLLILFASASFVLLIVNLTANWIWRLIGG